MGEMIIEGSNSTLRLDGFGNIFLRHNHQKEKKHEYNWIDKGFAGDSVYALQNHLINCFQNNIDTPLSAKKYLRNLEIEENIYQSNILKSRVECK